MYSLDWNGTTYTSTGIYTDTLQSLSGCDSLITLDLTINNGYLADTTILVACDGAGGWVT